MTADDTATVVTRRECPVCLDEFETVPSVGPCGHRVCGGCLAAWARQNAEAPCPFCKRPTAATVVWTYRRRPLDHRLEGVQRALLIATYAVWAVTWLFGLLPRRSLVDLALPAVLLEESLCFYDFFVNGALYHDSILVRSGRVVAWSPGRLAFILEGRWREIVFQHALAIGLQFLGLAVARVLSGISLELPSPKEVRLRLNLASAAALVGFGAAVGAYSRCPILVVRIARVTFWRSMVAERR